MAFYLRYSTENSQRFTRRAAAIGALQDYCRALGVEISTQEAETALVEHGQFVYKTAWGHWVRLSNGRFKLAYR